MKKEEKVDVSFFFDEWLMAVQLAFCHAICCFRDDKFLLQQ